MTWALCFRRLWPSVPMMCVYMSVILAAGCSFLFQDLILFGHRVASARDVCLLLCHCVFRSSRCCLQVHLWEGLLGRLSVRVSCLFCILCGGDSVNSCVDEGTLRKGGKDVLSYIAGTYFFF